MRGTGYSRHQQAHATVDSMPRRRYSSLLPASPSLPPTSSALPYIGTDLRRTGQADSGQLRRDKT